MKTVTLFRTISADHISHRGYKWLEEEKRWIETGNPNDGFKWGGVGEWTEAPDWDDNPDIDDTNGLQAEGNGIWFGYLNLEDDILQIIKVPSDTLVISKDKRAWRFKRAFTKKEYKIENTKKFLNVLIKYNIESLIYKVLENWKIKYNIKKRIFKKLNDGSYPSLFTKKSSRKPTTLVVGMKA